MVAKRQKRAYSCRAFNPRIDFAAKRSKIDRLGEGKQYRVGNVEVISNVRAAGLDRWRCNDVTPRASLIVEKLNARSLAAPRRRVVQQVFFPFGVDAAGDCANRIAHPR